MSGGGNIEGKGLRGEERGGEGVGNKGMSVKEWKNVRVKDVWMLGWGELSVVGSGVEKLRVKNVKVDRKGEGFEIECWKNVGMRGWSVKSGWDDGIVVK